MNPLVSIIVPCYNQSEWLDEALESVVKQTYKNWECIIVDDGSSDGSAEVAKEWLKRDDRYAYFFQVNSGLSSARNKGIAQSSGEFILPLDSDDKVGPRYIELAVQKFQSEPNLKLVYCKAKMFGIKSGPWKLPHYSLKNLAVRNIIFCSALFKKKDWRKIGGYDPKMDAGYEDWEFWISLLKKNGGVSRLEYTGFYYRTANTSMLNSITHSKEKILFEYLSIKHADFFVEQLGSFQAIYRRIERLENEHLDKLKSEKFALDLFLQTFFGFYIFKNRIRGKKDNSTKF